MKYILGVDGGGSKTYSVITNENGEKLGEGIADGANYQMIGLEKGLAHIRQSIEAALTQAGLSYEQISFAQFALAGADREIDFSNLTPALAELPLHQWDLVCDTLAGLRIGSPENIGVVLVCGSGTNAVGKDESGRMVQIGGFGYLYGDAAGGSYMAQETFRAAVRSWESRESPSILVDLVPQYYGYKDMKSLWNDFLDQQIQRVSSDLTVVLHKAADQGDHLAIKIMKDTGVELGLAANSVIKRLNGLEKKNIPIVLIGTIFQRGKSRHLIDSLLETIKKQHDKVQLIIPEMEPVYGAILLAMDQLNIKVKSETYELFNTYRRALVDEQLS